MAPTLEHEMRILAGREGCLIAIDEVGRGALAGPVTVGAVAIDVRTHPQPSGIDDSKAVTPRRRQALVPDIFRWARGMSISHVSARRIDAVGLSAALGEAARGALHALSHLGVRCVLVDGIFDFVSPVTPGWETHVLEKADSSCASVAAASIIAKESRDALMRTLHERHPEFCWNRNVGYGTADHRRAIRSHGPTEFHRRSWRLLRD